MLSYTKLAVTVAEADDYAVSRGWTDWTGTNEQKESALRRSQDYIAGSYNSCWADEWDNDHAPDVVKFAIIEGAKRELDKPGYLQPDVTLSGQVASKKVKAGPAEVETKFGEVTSASAARPDIAAIDNLLKSAIRRISAMNFKIVRA